MSENIVKKVCKELGLTYRELGERIGVSESSLRSAASTGKISNQVKKAIELFVELQNTKQQLKDYEELQKLLKKMLS